MGRSKEMGKPVSELTRGELEKELHRCKSLIRVYGKGVAVKGLQKRLLEIEKRISSGS